MSNVNSNNGYGVNRLSAANIQDLAILFTSVYGKGQPPGYFERKYDTAYTGAQYIGFIAYNDQQQPVAFYGVIPCFMICNSETILSAQSADTMTHPEHRNKGLFVELAGHTFELCVQTGIKLLFGFPNQNSLPGFINKLGWLQAEQMDYFIVPVKTLPLQKIAGKLPVFKELYTRYVYMVLKKYRSDRVGIPSSVLSNDFDGVLRDEGYLQNKTCTDTVVLNINGNEAWIKPDNRLLIGDLHIDTFEFLKVLQSLKHIARVLGLGYLQFHTSRGTKLHALFQAQYKPVSSYPVIFKTLDNHIDTRNIKFTFADIDIF